MRGELLLAYRSLGRNPVRSALLGAGILVGAFLTASLSSVMDGLVDGMLRRATGALVPPLQVSSRGFLDAAGLEDSLSGVQGIVANLRDAGVRASPRLLVSGLAQTSRKQRSIRLLGIESDDPAFQIHRRILRGATFDGIDGGVMVTEGLARKLDILLGERLVVFSTGSAGDLASSGFPVRAILETPGEGQEDIVVMERTRLGEFLGSPGSANQIALVLPDPCGSACGEALASIGETTAWEEASPLTKAQIVLYGSFTGIWMVAVLLGLGLGVSNTVSMTVRERGREFAVSRAMGAPRRTLALSLFLEQGILAAISGGVGLLLARLLIGCLEVHGIDLASVSGGADTWGFGRVVHPRWDWFQALGIAASLVVVSFLATAWPAFEAMSRDPATGLRSEVR